MTDPDPLKPSTWKVVGTDDDGRVVMLCPATGEWMIEDEAGDLVNVRDLRAFEVDLERWVQRVAIVSVRARDAEHARRLALLAATGAPFDDGDTVRDVEATAVREVAS